MTKARLDGSPRSPRSPELSVNYARTQWKLALLWQGFFFFGRRPAVPHLSAPTRRYASAGYLLPPRFKTWPAFSSSCRILALGTILARLRGRGRGMPLFRRGRFPTRPVGRLSVAVRLIGRRCVTQHSGAGPWASKTPRAARLAPRRFSRRASPPQTLGGGRRPTVSGRRARDRSVSGPQLDDDVGRLRFVRLQAVRIYPRSNLQDFTAYRHQIVGRGVKGRRPSGQISGDTSAHGRFCSLIPGFGVKLSVIILAGPTVLSAVGACPPHDGVRRRWWINVASAVSLMRAGKKSGDLTTAIVPAGTSFPARAGTL